MRGSSSKDGIGSKLESSSSSLASCSIEDKEDSAFFKTSSSKSGSVPTVGVSGASSSRIASSTVSGAAVSGAVVSDSEVSCKTRAGSPTIVSNILAAAGSSSTASITGDSGLTSSKVGSMTSVSSGADAGSGSESIDALGVGSTGGLGAATGSTLFAAAKSIASSIALFRCAKGGQCCTAIVNPVAMPSSFAQCAIFLARSFGPFAISETVCLKISPLSAIPFTKFGWQTMTVESAPS